jgi:choline dehydrogenase
VSIQLRRIYTRASGLIKLSLLAVMTVALTAVIIAIGLRLAFNFERIANLVPIESVQSKHFDYIIIGAGSAGSVLAFELTKRSNRTVLLVEAGGIFNGLSSVPLMSTLMQGSEMDWRLKSVSQRHSSHGLTARKQALPRGKGLGGSSNLNYLLHFAGLQRDFDEWTRLGADGWDYDKLRHSLTRHESPNAEHDTPKLSITSIKSRLGDAFIDAGDEMRETLDASVTLSLARFTTRKGLRHSAYHEYLRRAFRHRNLSIMVHAKAKRILFNEANEAIGVEVQTESQPAVKVFADREVIVSAGAYHTPQLLKLSGVGDEGELSAVGINLHHHSPSVGGNLFDHMNFPLFVSINETASVTVSKVLSASEIYRFLMDGEGVLATTAVVGTGRLGDAGLILFGMGSADERALKHIANFETETFRAFFPLHANASQEGFTALSTCLHPRSRGSVRLNPQDPWGEPLIDPEYLSDDHDLRCMRRAVRLSLEMVATKAFRRLDAKVHWPRLRSCDNFGPFDNAVSDRYVDCLVRHAALTAHHPGGTCAIGSVVDSELRFGRLPGRESSTQLIAPPLARP